jgi:hypothetical protein
LDQSPIDGTNQVGVMTPGAELDPYVAGGTSKFSECFLE